MIFVSVLLRDVYRGVVISSSSNDLFHRFNVSLAVAKEFGAKQMDVYEVKHFS